MKENEEITHTRIEEHRLLIYRYPAHCLNTSCLNILFSLKLQGRFLPNSPDFYSIFLCYCTSAIKQTITIDCINGRILTDFLFQLHSTSAADVNMRQGVLSNLAEEQEHIKKHSIWACRQLMSSTMKDTF